MENKSPLDILPKRKFQPILFVDSSEIRLWKSPERCEMNLPYSPVIFTKSSKMMFLCHIKLQNHFRTQFTFDKWYSLNASCSFPTSWNFLLLHVWWLNNSQSCLLPPFYFLIFFCSLTSVDNGYFFNEFFRKCAVMQRLSFPMRGKNSPAVNVLTFCAPC